MSGARKILSVLREYGPAWAVSRALYSAKLKLLNVCPASGKLYEKKTPRPVRTDIFRIDTDALKCFLLGLDDRDKAKLIETADKACEGVITGFSSVELNYGNPIDWQLNPLTGKRCNEAEMWYSIPDFDSERGDIKAVWESSRFSHFITFSRAYLLTGDDKYRAAFSDQLASWLEKNPYGHGANFKCSQECSLRMVNALLAYSIFSALGVCGGDDESNIKELIDRCYRKILSNFFYAYRCIKNNHTISELMGIIIGAWCCGDDNRLEKGYRLLDKVISQQFTEDGGYGQYSFNYQRLAMQDMECVLSISGSTGLSLSRESIDRLKASALLMYQCQDECGDMPNYGNNDGALVFPVTCCGYRDFTPAINTLYALTAGSRLYGDGAHDEELIWFSGGKTPDMFGMEHIERVSSRFMKAGLFTLRAPGSWLMSVASDYKSRPAHMDQNHIDLWIGGVNVLCDAGTYSYAGKTGRTLMSNRSHNTAYVEGKPQMNLSGPFLVYDRTRRELGRCDDNRFECVIVSANGYTHKRTVVSGDNSYEIADSADKDFRVLFHTPCEVTLENDAVILTQGGKALCRIQSTGEISVSRGSRSLYYLRLEDTACIEISGSAGTEIKTVIEIGR